MACDLLTVGVNVPDHDMTFQSLSELLRCSVTPHVASVQAKECGGNVLKLPERSGRLDFTASLGLFCWIISALKHLMKRVLERLMDATVALDDDDEEEEEIQQSGSRLHKSVHCSLAALCDWYSSKAKARAPSMWRVCVFIGDDGFLES